MLTTRSDATPAVDVPFTRRVMPFLMPTRTESTVYFEQQLDVTDTLGFIERFNAEHPEQRITVFHVFMWAMARTLAERPRLNRFVSGGKLWNRNGVWLSFAAKKKKLDGDAPLVTIKREFDPNASLLEVARQVNGEIVAGRSTTKRAVDKELDLAFKLPSFALRLVFAGMRWLDRWNLLPASLIRTDPLYTSMFVANLGSVGLDAAYHHLYEWGNCPFFAALGQVKEVRTEQGLRQICTVRYSFDERIEDGLYCAKGLELVKRYVEELGRATSTLRVA